MDDDVMKKIEERIQALPKDVQEAILASDFEDRIAKIGQANRLHVDQIGNLGDETLLVMLGFAPLDGLAERLQKKLHLYNEQASVVATAVNDEVFLPIRESIKKFQAAHTIPPTVHGPAVQATSPAVAPAPAPTGPPSSTIPKITFNTRATMPPQAQKPANPPAMESADMMLSQKTVSLPVQKPATPAPQAPTAPKTSTPSTPPPPSAPKVGDSYKTDPYREPVE